MCAINGISWIDEALVRRMNEKTAHRGPDGTAVCQVGNFATLGHNRLAIIDPDLRSNQPMESSDGRYVIVYNGEVYNFKELRNRLRNKYDFQTESDTEVILAGFQEWGADVFKKLNGMYALLICDTKTKNITVARDPIGIKPLYFVRTAQGYAFSSEIKALLETDVLRILNHHAFDAYMRALYVPEPMTMFRGIEKFPAGHIGILQNNVLTTTPFQYATNVPPIDAHDVDGLRSAFSSAVSRQMVSDRPLGVYLSGGIDSSAVLAAATKAGGNMDTYSIGFELETGEESEKFNADSVLAKRIAAHFGARHHEFFISPNNVLALFEKAIYHLDEPIANATIAAQVALSEKARESVVVALTGDGGDEVFGGYPRYLLTRRMDVYQRFVPDMVTNILPGHFGKLATRSLENRFALFHFQKDKELKLFLTETQQTPHMNIENIENIMEADRKTWLIDEALVRSDKLAMANGLETRPPFLDLELVHQVKDISFEKHVSLFETKVLLKRALRDELPEWVLNQPKRGWFSPGAKWLRHNALMEELRHVLSAEYAPATSHLFNWKGVAMMFEEHREKKKYHATALLSVLMFQLWSKAYTIGL